MKSALEYSTARQAVTDLVLEVFHLNGGLLTAGDSLSRQPRADQRAVGMQRRDRPVARASAGRASTRTMGPARQSVQCLVDEMKKGGLVRHAPDQPHRRAILALLTKAGESACRATMLR